ncbi:MAG: PQQ-dependent sugar dehydrogenase [Litorimonas sp.]
MTSALRSLRPAALLLLGAALLSACLEAQPAPDLPEVATSELTLAPVVEGLASPWAVEPLPQGGYLVTGKLGKLWRVEGGAVREISGLPDDIVALSDNQIATDGQGGLLDVALAPDFARSGEIYLSYSYGDWDANGTALLRARLNGDRLEGPDVIFRAGPAKEAGSHYGGKIVFLPDGTLLLSLGDGFALREEAQKPSSHLGSVVRLTRDGGAPADNPDFGDGAPPELFTIGHRNVQGLALDPQTGAIWEHEHGPRGGDELNRLTPGANYGWPIVTRGRDYQGARISPIESDPRYAEPVHGWTPSIAPSGLAIYRGDFFPDWNGHALVGGLASGDLRLVDTETGLETILLSDAKTDDDSFRVRDVTMDLDGAVLVLVEDAENGRLYRLTP